MNKDRMIKTTIWLMIITACSKLIGFLREVLIAYRFGSDMGTDAFFISRSIYGVIFALAGAGLGLAIIPMLSRIREEKPSEEEGYIHSITVVFLFVSLFLIGLSYLFAEPLVRLFAIGFSGEQLSLAARFVRLGLPVIALNFIYSIYEAFNHSKNRFYVVALGGFALNLPIVVYLLFFNEYAGLFGLVISMTIGYALRSLLVYLPVKNWGARRGPIADYRAYLWGTFSLMIPIMMTTIISNINHVIDRNLASTLAEGSISALNYSATTKDAFMGLFIVSMITVIYPSFSDWVVKKDWPRVRRMFTYSVSMILLITIPATAGIMLLNREIVEIIFMRGAFELRDVVMTSSALFFYALGITGAAVNAFIDKVYYAYHDSKTAMKIGSGAVVLNIILNLILVKFMQHNGLALATSIAVTVGVFVKIIFLRGKALSPNYSRLGKLLIKSLVSTLLMLLVVNLVRSNLFDLLVGSTILKMLKLGCVVLSGVLVYILGFLLLSRVVKDEEPYFPFKRG
jgi:putative peptidoglycan lipid II flippase